MIVCFRELIGDFLQLKPFETLLFTIVRRQREERQQKALEMKRMRTLEALSSHASPRTQTTHDREEETLEEQEHHRFNLPELFRALNSAGFIRDAPKFYQQRESVSNINLIKAALMIVQKKIIPLKMIRNTIYAWTLICRECESETLPLCSRVLNKVLMMLQLTQSEKLISQWILKVRPQLEIQKEERKWLDKTNELIQEVESDYLKKTKRPKMEDNLPYNSQAAKELFGGPNSKAISGVLHMLWNAQYGYTVEESHKLREEAWVRAHEEKHTFERCECRSCQNRQTERMFIHEFLFLVASALERQQELSKVRMPLPKAEKQYL